MSTTPSELFVCVYNAGRSQMAAGFLSRLAGDAMEVRSARSVPTDSSNPLPSRRWPRWASTSRRKHRKSSPPMPCKPQMW